MSAGLALELLQKTNWEEVVMLACAWAYRDRIPYKVGQDTYRTVMKVSSRLRREHLRGSPDYENVVVNDIDLCHSYNNDDSLHGQTPTWILFSNLHRYPVVSGIVLLPNSIGALFTNHIVSSEPADTKELTLLGLKKFFLEELPNKHVETLVLAVRPRAADPRELPDDEADESEEAEEPEEEDQEKNETDHSALSIPQSIRITDWSQDFLERVQDIVNSIDNIKEFSHFVTSLKNDFPRYKAQAETLIEYYKQHSPATLREHLRSEREHLVDFLLEAAQYFIVRRFVIRKYLTSCEHAARKQDSASGIFSPDRDADILEALMKHQFYLSEDSLQHLRDTLPGALFTKKSKKGKRRNVETQQVNQTNKRIPEKIRKDKKARQFVEWNNESHRFEASWTTREELEARYGFENFQKIWRTSCFSGALKAIEEFETPVTQAKAMAHWLNNNWTWEDCTKYWKQWPDVWKPKKEADEVSRKRMKQNLDALISLPTV